MYRKIIGFGLLLAVLDQIIKYLIVNNLDIAQDIEVINNFFYITYIKNSGAAFGIFQNGGIILIALSIVALIGLIRYIVVDKNITKLESISYSLVFAGILGNLIDRVFNGYIVDYLDFYIFGYNFPVFNLADMCIVIGFGIIIYNMYITKGDTNENNFGRGKKRHKN